MKVFLFCFITWVIYFAIGVVTTGWLSLGPWPQIIFGLVLAVFWIVGNEWFKERQ